MDLLNYLPLPKYPGLNPVRVHYQRPVGGEEQGGGRQTRGLWDGVGGHNYHGAGGQHGVGHEYGDEERLLREMGKIRKEKM